MITLSNRKSRPAHSLLDPFFFGANDLSMSPKKEVNSKILHNILKGDDHFIIELAAPGFAKKDFGIDIVENSLVISLKTEKSDLKEDETIDQKVKETMIRKEFHFSDFKKTFRLPVDADKNSISANYENGILLVTIPMKEKVTRQVNVM